MRYDLLILLLIAFGAVVYALASDGVQSARLHRLGPMCAADGLHQVGYEWELIDFNMGGPAKCRDPRTKLMYEPDDVFYAR